MVLAHRVTTPVVITVCRAAARDLQSPEKERVQVVTTPAVITVWLRQIAVKQPFTDLVLARVALIPAVITASLASDPYRATADLIDAGSINQSNPNTESTSMYDKSAFTIL